ncbi:TetR/AcrR family transcriptional regulator [uncultured Tessaracoccus sp.]|uniref:TetR/AcrR family transcriptional regulator n=1 Tax=uncultured Tessaracoccus sp. TaxID=905023 RepID=UPI0025DD4BF9|nr:TetR/AcrR family transcriptional regulator [uncultured Tessaracoccus sp.]
MEAPLGRRARHRKDMERRILELGREQLATVGAAGVSLRAVARELGVASSAVYRYVASRDELLTLLIAQSYDALGDAVDDALDPVPGDDADARWTTLGRATRAWAVRRPHDWALLYGSPVPGYHAPPERTLAGGTRLVGHVLDIARTLHVAGRAAPAGATVAARGVADTEVRAADPAAAELPSDLLVAATTAWTLLIGSVSSEVFQQLGPLGDGYAALHETNVATGLRLLRGS